MRQARPVLRLASANGRLSLSQESPGVLLHQAVQRGLLRSVPGCLGLHLAGSRWSVTSQTAVPCIKRFGTFTTGPSYRNKWLEKTGQLKAPQFSRCSGRGSVSCWRQMAFRASRIYFSRCRYFGIRALMTAPSLMLVFTCPYLSIAISKNHSFLVDADEPKKREGISPTDSGYQSQ